MSEKSWYKDWFSSPYYHRLYQHRDDREAVSFIERLIEHLQPAPKATMLDVACGKGRHSIALSEMNFDVTGIDLSFPSIAEAKESENEMLHFYQHDMRLPFWINYFDYAFNFFTSFGYFKTKREHDNAIRTIAQSLKKEGILVIDYLNVYYAADNSIKSQIIPIDDAEFHITKWHDESHFYKQIQVVDGNNKTIKHLYTEKVAKFSLGDFTEMLSYQHMQIQEVFGNYHLSKYDIKKSPRLIIVAKKLK
jgi:2-polyprenyl-3-methyl-5-hydroxy-6-metoxy-1,4-benzoquinol methylase